MDLVRASPAAGQPTATGPQDPQDSEETVYVEAATAEDLANVTVASVGGSAGGQQQPGGGLHLTTITVAVPAPLSPSDVLQQHVVTSGPPQVALPTVPAPQEAAVRWKYEHNKAEKPLTSHTTGSSLVSHFKLRFVISKYFRK